MKLKVDPDICIGCGLCADTCPSVYRMEGDKAVVFVTIVPPDSKDSAIKAKGECPVEAILEVDA